MTIEPIDTASVARVPVAESHPAWDQDLRRTGTGHRHAHEPHLEIAVQRAVPDSERADEPEPADATGTTALLLRMAGLHPDDADVAAMSARLHAARSAVRALYAVPETRYEEPGLAFRAMP